MLLEEQGKEVFSVSASPYSPWHKHMPPQVPFSSLTLSLTLFLLPNEKAEPSSSLELSAEVKMLLSTLSHYPCLSFWSHPSLWLCLLICRFAPVFPSLHSWNSCSFGLSSSSCHHAAGWPCHLTSLMLKCWHAHTAQLYMSGSAGCSFCCCGFGLVFGRSPPSPPKYLCFSMLDSWVSPSAECVLQSWHSTW